MQLLKCDEEAFLSELLRNGGSKSRQQDAMHQSNEASMQVMKGFGRIPLRRPDQKRRLVVVYVRHFLALEPISTKRAVRAEALTTGRKTIPVNNRGESGLLSSELRTNQASHTTGEVMKSLVRFAHLALALLAPLHGSAHPNARNLLHDLPPMNSARAAHTLTTLQDGSILVVGGFMGEENQIAGIELFDAERQQFRTIDNALTPRQSHSAASLPNGHVLIAGGYGAQAHNLDTAEVFDPATRKFSSTGRMKVPRADHTSVVLADGSVALIGGLTTDWTLLDSIEIYNPKTGAFSEAGHMSVPRAGHVSVVLRDGRIFIAGGHVGRSLELEDPQHCGDFRSSDRPICRYRRHADGPRQARRRATNGRPSAHYRGYRWTGYPCRRRRVVRPVTQQLHTSSKDEQSSIQAWRVIAVVAERKSVDCRRCSTTGALRSGDQYVHAPQRRIAPPWKLFGCRDATRPSGAHRRRIRSTGCAKSKRVDIRALTATELAREVVVVGE